MLKLNDNIRLSAYERDFLSFAAQEPVNPSTVTQHDDWIDYAIEKVWNGDTPEFRLMRAVLESHKIGK
jgi:hypothetical protein